MCVCVRVRVCVFVKVFMLYRVHASVGGITVLGVAQESHDTTIISTPETKEKTGTSASVIINFIIVDDIITTLSAVLILHY